MAIKDRPTRIQLKGHGVYEEGRAGATITPGMLVAINAAGALIPHGTAGGKAENAFALEDALQGKTIRDNYASGDLVFYTIFKPGDVVFARLAAGENVAEGDGLSSNGDGTLQKIAGTESRIAVALEAVDLSDTGDVVEHIRARIV